MLDLFLKEGCSGNLTSFLTNGIIVFALKTFDGTTVHNSANARKLKLLERAGHYITERRAGQVAFC